ncbi:MAG: FMN-binding protein [Porticoccaceae bacterium]|nr:FMN-binding protein [Porticoccaceae bacterium]
MCNKLYRAALAVASAALIAITSLASFSVSAKGVFQSGPDFVAEVFAPQQAVAKVLWLTPEIRAQAAAIVDHPVRGLRIRYHQSESKSAWILEEIGKEMPITIGVVVEDNIIQQVKILAYRESRGGEVRYPAYTKQYLGAFLKDNYRLSQNIDGITGATLSVWAVNKVAALALYYHAQANQNTDAHSP